MANINSLQKMEEIKDIINRKFDIRVHELNSTCLIADCRNWGQWQFPEDMDCDDGEDEDCDYEELTEESSRELEEFFNILRKDYPEYSCTYNTSEKNYIDFQVTPKEGR